MNNCCNNDLMKTYGQSNGKEEQVDRTKWRWNVRKGSDQTAFLHSISLSFFLSFFLFFFLYFFPFYVTFLKDSAALSRIYIPA